MWADGLTQNQNELCGVYSIRGFATVRTDSSVRCLSCCCATCRCLSASASSSLRCRRMARESCTTWSGRDRSRGHGSAFCSEGPIEVVLLCRKITGRVTRHLVNLCLVTVSLQVPLGWWAGLYSSYTAQASSILRQQLPEKQSPNVGSPCTATLAGLHCILVRTVLSRLRARDNGSTRPG